MNIAKKNDPVRNDPVGINPKHKNRLHEALGIKPGKKIPLKRLKAAVKSKDPHLREMAQYALNSLGWAKPN